MPTQLDERPEASADDKIQRDYAEEFSKITGSKNYSKDGTSGDLSGGKKGLFKNENDDSAGKSGAGKSALRGAEGAAGTAGAAGIAGGLAGGAAGIAKKLGGKLFGSRRRKQATGGGIIGTVLIAVGIGGFSVVSGPLELIHISQLLQKMHLTSQENQSSDRTTKLIRYVMYPNKPQNVRMSYLGNKYADKIETRMNSQGIKSTYTQNLGFLDAYEIDRTNDKYKNRSTAEITKEFKDTYGVDVTERNGRLLIEGKSMGYYKHGRFVRLTLANAGYGRVPAGIQAKTMGTRAGFSWHPIQKIDNKILRSADERLAAWRKARVAAVNNGTTTTIQTNAATQDDPNATQEQKDAARANAGDAEGVASEINDEAKKAGAAAAEGKPGAIEGFKSSLTGKITLGVAGVAGLACMARGVAADADNIKQAQVILPAMRIGLDIVSAGDQVRYGNDSLTIQQVGDYRTVLNDPTTKQSWAEAESLQAEQGKPNTGVPASDTLKTITEGTPFDFLSEEPFDTPLSAVCSTVGQVALVIVSFLGGPISAAIGTALGFAFGPAIMDALASWLAGSPIPALVAGPAFGNTANYGVALAASDIGTSNAAGPLSQQDADQLVRFDRNEWDTEFKSQSIAYQLFSPTDPKSMLAQFIDTHNGGIGQEASKFAASFTNIGATFGSLSNLFAGKSVQAATTSRYDYGFPTHAYTIAEMEDERTMNPYENSAEAAKLLDGAGGADYIAKAERCFGIRISQTALPDGTMAWDTASVGTTPKLKDTNADECKDKSLEWLRIRFFIRDTNAMKSMACFEGDEESCSSFYATETVSTTNPALVLGHPSIFVNKSQLDFVKAKIASGAQPWADLFNNHLKTNRLAAANYTATPVSTLSCSGDNTGCEAIDSDGRAAYTNALLYSYTGDAQYAKKAIQILNAWSTTLKTANTSDAQTYLYAAWAAEMMPRAAEIIRYTYTPGPNDEEQDVTAFANMLSTVLQPLLADTSNASRSSNGNWDLSMIDGLMNIAVFNDDKVLLQKAIDRWKVRAPAYIYAATDNGSNGLPLPPPGGLYSTQKRLQCFWLASGSPSESCDVSNWLLTNGQSQETCRDYVHVGLGMAALFNAAETARLNGVDLFAQEQVRLKDGMEFNAGIMNSKTIPDNICKGRAAPATPVVTMPTYTIAYNNLAIRLGQSMPNTAQLMQVVQYKNGGPYTDTDPMMAWESLTHTGAP